LSLSSKKQKAPVLSRGLNLKTKTGGFAPPAIVKLKGGSHERRLIAKLNITNFLNEKQVTCPPLQKELRQREAH
jgi:hypothetical protein